MKTLQEVSGPVVPVRKLLERDVQKQCVEWARARGYWARKFSSMTQRSVPDYLLSKLHHDTQLVFACEFKAPGKVATDAQVDERDAMINSGWLVFECDSVEKFRAIVEELEDASA